MLIKRRLEFLLSKFALLVITFAVLTLSGCSGCGGGSGCAADEPPDKQSAPLPEKPSRDRSDVQASAQGKACPAMIKDGNWKLTPLKRGDVVTSSDEFGIGLTGQASKGKGGTVEIERTCKGSFDLIMKQYRIEMHPQGFDKKSKAAIFVGNPTFDGVSAVYAFKNTAPNEGNLNIQVQAPKVAGGKGTVNFPNHMKSIEQSSERVECQCRNLLEQEIGEMIDEAQSMMDAYSDKDLRKKPADVLQKNWIPKTYDELVGKFVEQSSPPIPHSDKVSNQVTGITVVTAAETDPNCKIHIGDAYLYYCNSEVAKESTILHETLHQAQCEAKRVKDMSTHVAKLKKELMSKPQEKETDVLSEMAAERDAKFRSSDLSVPDFADDEVRAYQKEIEFLSSWIQSNCDK